MGGKFERITPLPCDLINHPKIIEINGVTSLMGYGNSGGLVEKMRRMITCVQ